MWLKLYLDISLSCPTWAIVIDLIINTAALPGTSVLVRVNTFTQSNKRTLCGTNWRKYHEDAEGSKETWHKPCHNLTLNTSLDETPSMVPPLLWTLPHDKCHSLMPTKKTQGNHCSGPSQSAKKLQNQQRNEGHTPSPTCDCCSCCNQDRTDGCLNPMHVQKKPWQESMS